MLLNNEIDTILKFGKEMIDFKSIREKKKISIEKVALDTRININYLNALENEEFDFLPKPYIIGFAKTYARYLGISEKLVQEHYDAIEKIPPDTGNLIQKKRKRS